MKDFLNIRINCLDKKDGKTLVRVRHTKREKVIVEFTVSNKIKSDELPGLIRKFMSDYVKKYAASNLAPLTPNQKALYDGLVSFHKTEGRPPTYDEQRMLIGAKSKGTPWQTSRKLLTKGWLWEDEYGNLIPVDISLPYAID